MDCSSGNPTAVCLFGLATCKGALALTQQELTYMDCNYAFALSEVQEGLEEEGDKQDDWAKALAWHRQKPSCLSL